MALKLHVGPYFNIRLCEYIKCDNSEILPSKMQWNFVFTYIHTSFIKPVFVNKRLCIPTFAYITGYHTVCYSLFAISCSCVHENVLNVLYILQHQEFRERYFVVYNRWNAFVCRVLLTSKLVCAYYLMTIPVAALSKACVCGRSLAGFVSSNPAGGMCVCLLWVLCVVR